MRHRFLLTKLRSPIVIAFLLLCLLQINYTLSSYKIVREVNKAFMNLNNDDGSESSLMKYLIPYDDNLTHKEFEISFNFKNSNFQSGDLFQTDSEGSGLRVEQLFEQESDGTVQAKLLIQYRSWNEERSLTSEKTYSPENLNNFYLHLDFDNQLMVRINNEVFLNERISKQDIRYKEFILGAGLSGSRIFAGEISNTKMKLKFAERKPFIPTSILLGSILFVFMVGTFRQKKIEVKFLDVFSALVTSTSIVIIQSLFSFADFFGDDFLNIWPIRRSDPLTIFSESVGANYRPITETIFLLRWDIHGEDIRAWMFGTYTLLFLTSIIQYFTLKKVIGLGCPTTSLLNLVLFTSPIYIGGTFWWASNGTQHIISISLSLLLVSAIFDVYKSADKKCIDLQKVLFIAFCLCLTSEIFLPVLIVTPFVFSLGFNAIIFAKKQKRKNFRRSQNPQLKFSRNIDLKRRICNSTWKSYVSYLAFLAFLRYFLAEVPFAVAASSAANYRFTSISLNSVTQFFAYILSMFNFYVSQKFYDIAAGNGALLDFLSSRKYLVNTISILSMILLLLALALIVKSKYYSRKLNRIGNEVISVDEAFPKILAGLAVTGYVAPALVPNYLQLRWIQFSYLLAVILVAFLLKNKQKNIRILSWSSICLLLISNLQTLYIDFNLPFR